MLDGFSGYLQTDGYAGYNPVAARPDITQLGCWAHARRKFDAALKSSSAAAAHVAWEGLRLIRDLYEIDNRAKNKPLNQRHQHRQQQVVPQLDRIRTWFEEHAAFGLTHGGLLTTAFTYLQNQRSKLIRFVEDPRLHMDNNVAERHVRSIAVGRRAWLFCRSEARARASAGWYSLVETALSHPFIEAQRPNRSQVPPGPFPEHSPVEPETAGKKNRPVILSYRGTCKRDHDNIGDRPMPRMLPGIDTVAQHQERVQNDPDAYRPERCPHCGKAGLHHHGHYERNPPRGEGLAFSLGQLLILRFCCPCCRCTCSRLPACLSRWRQYGWQTQQAVLDRTLAGASNRAIAEPEPPSRHTIGRWGRRLEARFKVHAMHLRSRFLDLGRAPGCQGF